MKFFSTSINRLWFIMAFILFTGYANAQLTGTKTIPGDYGSIAAAVTALNTSGVGTGGVAFNVAAGHTESVSESILLTATGTSSNPITFQKNGGGANPKVTRTDAGTLATTTLGGQGDAVILIEGSDYVTFDGIDAAASDQGIEYGYYLRKASGTDGCKNVTIKNAAITMTKGTSALVAGIYSSNNDATSLVTSATGITVTSVDGRNENVTITGNTISNVFAGIVLRGFVHATPYDFYDQNFVVGSSGAGNTIQNFAGNATSTAYGVYLIYHNNANVSFNSFDNMANGGSFATGILYAIFHSTGVTSSFTANNNNINVTTNTSSLYGVNTAATGNLTLDDNTVQLNTAGTSTGTLGYLYNSSAAASTAVSISNNTFVGTDLLTTSGSVYLIYNNSSQLTPGVTNVQGNSISGVLNRTATTGTTYCYYNNGSPTGTENFFNNVFDSVSTTGTGALYGFLSTTGSSHTHHVYNNTIREFSRSGTGLVYGIHRTLASGSVHTNSVYNITGGGTVYGISSGTGNQSIYRNNIHNLTSTSALTTAGLVTGIYLSGSTNTYIFNNFISNLKAPSAEGTDAIRGIGSISLTATSNIGLYYNTIFLNASSAGTNFGTSGIFHTLSATATTAALDMRNNIITNNSTPGGTGLTVAFRRSAATSLLNYSELSNNNSFYAGTPSAANLIFYDGTNSDQTMADFKGRVAPREASSFSENPPFVNSTTAPYNLHLSTTTPTQIESGGAPITSPLAITEDFDMNLRDASTPDVGADEFNGVALDLSGPIISYTALANTGLTSARTLTADISDASGVPTSGTGLPMLYWNVNSGSYTGVQASFISGNQYSFSFGAGVATNDTIRYYVVAQDSLNNVSASPSGGAGGFTVNPPAASTPPTTPNSYIITNPSLSGDYTVGISAFNSIAGLNLEYKKFTRRVIKEVELLEDDNLANGKNDKEFDVLTSAPKKTVLKEVEEEYWALTQNGNIYLGPQVFQLPTDNYEAVYATITAAITDLNLRGVSGPVRLLLIDTLFTEAGAMTINITNESNTTATNNVTIKPATGVSTTINTTSTSPVFIIASNYIILDGSNANGGTSRDMTISNSGTAASSGVAFVTGSNVTLKNLKGMANASNQGYGIVFSAAQNGMVDNCELKRATIGVQAQSSSNNITVTNNVIGSDEASEKIQNLGIMMLSTTNFTVSNNVISGLSRATGGSSTGISAAWQGSVFPAPTPGVISNNTIRDVKMTGFATSGYQALGISLSSSEPASDITVFNNSVSDVLAGGDGSTSGIDWTAHGIYIHQGGGYKIYFNSVNMFGDMAFAGTGTVYTGALTIRNGFGVGGLDIRNNVLNNSQTASLATGTKKGYAVYSGMANTAFTMINYNDYYFSGPDGGFGFLGVDQPNLAAWQTATGQDANSKSANPLYTDSTNLRPLQGSPVLFAGTSITGITTDIMGFSRTSTPSMGAYEFPIGTIGWANLQWPGTGTVPFGQNLTVYGQIWVDGVTNPAGQAPGILAWVGINSSNTNPNSWTTWVPASYNTDAGNNDEYQGNIGSTLTPGTHYYAYRWQLYGGDFYYGGFSGTGGGQWDGTTNVSGVLTVEDPPVMTNWELSSANSTMPNWFGASTERGLGWGMVDTGIPSEVLVGRLIVPSRNFGINSVYVLNDSTGALLDSLNLTGIAGGLFAINDAEVTHNGNIYVCNMTTNASTASFKVYRWNNLQSLPQVVIDYTAADPVRLGDVFTIEWDAVNGGYAIYAASATAAHPKVYKWNAVSSDSFNQVPTVITLSDALTGSIASVGPLQNGDFYFKYHGAAVKKYSANGTLIGNVPVGITAVGGAATKFVGTVGSNEYFVVFQSLTGNYVNAKIVEVPNGVPADAVLYGTTNSLGTTNTTGLGDVAVRHEANGTKTIFVLGTNNGIGSYRSSQVIPVELTAFAAVVKERTVTLNWATATETNSAFFEIERGNVNSGWQSLGNVKAAGTTTETNEYQFVDKNLNSGKYQYRLKIVNLDGTFDYSQEVEAEVGLPTVFSLSQNYPNPFNPTTKIDYNLPANSNVTVELFDITGQRVATLINKEQAAGYYTLEVNNLKLASGVYIYRMIAIDKASGKNFVNTKKMMMLK